MVAHDSISDALVLSGSSGTAVLNFTGATALEPGEQDWWWPGGPAVHSLWATWTAPTDGVVTFTLGGVPSWALEVWERVPGWDFATNGNDDLAYTDEDGQEPLAVTAGTTYLIWIDDYTWDTGGSPTTAATLSWQLSPFGLGGAVVTPDKQPWVPLKPQAFDAHFLSSRELYGWLGYSDPLPAELTAAGYIGVDGADLHVGSAPDAYRVIGGGWRLIDVTDPDTEFVVLESDISVFGNDDFWIYGYGSGVSTFAESLYYAQSDGGYDYYADGKADSAGRSFMAEVWYVYPERTVTYRLNETVTVPLTPATAAFMVLSDVEAAGIYAHGSLVVVQYHRSRPGDVEPTEAHTGPFGNLYRTIHAVSGTRVHLYPYWGAAYVGNVGGKQVIVTGTADGTIEVPEWASAYNLVIGPNLPGVTESVVTVRRYNPAAPSQREDYAFSIVWE